MSYNIIVVEMKTFVPTAEQLKKFSLKELRRYAKNLNVPLGKTKEEIIVNLIISGKVYVLASLEDLCKS